MIYKPQVGDLLAVEDETQQIILGMIYHKYKKGGRADYYRVEWFDETTSYEYNIGDIDTFRKQFVEWRDKECMSNVNVGTLVAVKNQGLHLKHVGKYTFGHVVEVKQIVGSKNIIKHYRVMWDNGNEFLYNDYEMDTYLKNIKDIKNS